MMVFVHHLVFVLEGDSDILKWLYTNVFAEGFIGVNFFFILSGFILAYNYQEKLNRKVKSKYDFYIARLARIFPLHLLTFGLAIPLMLPSFFTGNKIYWGIKFMANLTLTQSFIPVKSVYLTFNRPAWSISDEAFFYLVFPFLIYLISPKNKIKFSSTFWLSVSLLIIPILMIVVPENFQHQLFYVNPLIRITDFILGILLFNFSKKINKNHFQLNYTLLEISSIFILIVFFHLHSSVPLVFRFSFYYWIPMSFFILIFSFQSGVVSKILSHRILILLGEISFGFYMFHYLVIRYFEIFNAQFLFIKNDFLQIAIIFFLTITISYLSFFWFEKPVNNWMKNKYKKKNT